MCKSRSFIFIFFKLEKWKIRNLCQYQLWPEIFSGQILALKNEQNNMFVFFCHRYWKTKLFRPKIKMNVSQYLETILLQVATEAEFKTFKHTDRRTKR